MHEAATRLTFCPRCGLQRGIKLRFCGNCGFDFNDIAVPAKASEHRDAGEAHVAAPEPGLAARPGPKPKRRGNPADWLLEGDGPGRGRTRRLARPASHLNGPALGMFVVGLAGAAGAVLAWITVAIPNGQVLSSSGVEAGLIGVLALTGGATLAMAGLARALHAGSLALAQAVGLVGAVALIGAFALGFVSADSVAGSLLAGGAGVSGFGVGLFLVLVAGIAGIVFDGFVSQADA